MKKTSPVALRGVPAIIAVFEISTKIQHKINKIVGGTIFAL